jgi:GT2 family glycosyltransferase
VNYRTPELTLRCAEALTLERKICPGLEIVIVDGGSGDGSAQWLAEALSRRGWGGSVRFLSLSQNGGFGWANNQAMLHLLKRASPPAYIYLVNPDAVVEHGAVARLCSTLARNPDCGAAGSLLLDPDGSPAGSAFRFPSACREFIRGTQTAMLGRLLRVPDLVIRSDAVCDADWVTGASVLLRTEALKQVGLFDDGFFLYFEEVELMWRMRANGWRILHEPRSKVLHIGGASTGINLSASSRGKIARLPRYQFESRKRFFCLSRGPVYACLAALSFFCGACIGTIRAIAGRSRGLRAPFEILDHLRFAFIYSRFDSRSAAVDWNSSPGRDPAWRSRGQ